LLKIFWPIQKQKKNMAKWGSTFIYFMLINIARSILALS
jgi:hypothetical protein